MKLISILFEMEVKDALNLFGLTRSDLGNSELLKKKYRELSFKHHPDKGGSTEMMKLVNDAKQTLEKIKKSGSVVDWDAISKKYRELGERIKNILIDGFQYTIYTDYFEKIYNESFEFEMLNKFPTNEKNPSSAGFNIEFFNKDRSIVFSLRLSSVLSDATSSHVLGGGESNISFPLSLIAFGFFNNRKLKVAKSDYKTTNNHLVLQKPDLIFPKSKLEKFKKTSDKITFKKKDMITYLTRKLKAGWDGQTARIPITKDDSYKLYADRTVFMKHPTWMLLLYERMGTSLAYKSVRTTPVLSIPETIESAQFIEQFQKNAFRTKDMIKLVNAEFEKHRKKIRSR